MPNGCMCCRVRGDLKAAFKRIEKAQSGFALSNWRQNQQQEKSRFFNLRPPERQDQQTGKSYFSKMQLFGILSLLKSFLSPSWRFLALFDPKMGPEIDTKRVQKSDTKLPKIGPLLNPIFSYFSNFPLFLTTFLDIGRFFF